MKKISGFLLILLISGSVYSQEDPEFKKGYILHARVHNGMITTFHRSPEPFIAGLQFVPQYTIIPAKLRAGIVAGGFYTNQQIQALAGPTFSYKLKTFHAGPFGTAGNLQVNLDHLWGTDQQILFGGGIHLDLLNRVTLGLSVHRDYNLSNWWMQTAVGFRISGIKKTPEPFNQ